MSDDILAAATAALRTESDRDAGMTAEATRFRLRRSLAERTQTRRRVGVAGVVLAILFGTTVTWAWSTGRAQAAWRAVTGPAPTPVGELVVVAPVAEAPRVVAAPVVPRPPALAPGVVAAAPPPPPPVPPRVAHRTRRPVPVPARVVEDVAPTPMPPTAVPSEPVQSPEVEALYRRAHELHFRGGTATQALAAWDAYLAAEPSGRFLVEATYNRAIVLVKLKRYDEAMAALGPFARGEVKPAGYRQSEAKALLERIAAVNGASGSGH